MGKSDKGQTNSCDGTVKVVVVFETAECSKFSVKAGLELGFRHPFLCLLLHTHMAHTAHQGPSVLFRPNPHALDLF